MTNAVLTTTTAATASARLRVLLVDDDDLFRESLGLNLADEGYDVVPFDRGEPALAYLLDDKRADIVLLDWRMPKMDGLEVLRRMRAQGIDTPVIFLTHLSEQIYEEAALSGGAMDFVEKSRSLPILLKRMQLILAGTKTAVEDTRADAPDVYRLGALELRLDTSRAYWKGQRIDLTLTEFNIVRLMAGQPEEDVSYREIYDLVHGKGFMAGYGPSGYRANVRAFIKRIRQKFRSADGDFDAIGNYPGFGYRWGATPGAAGRTDEESALEEAAE